MPWMTRRTEIIDNNSHGLIRPHIVDIPVRVHSRVASIPTLSQ